MDISTVLIDWFLRYKRDLPWRGITEPYPVWVSEIILQQTRVKQGLGYFQRFMQAFPSVRHLAAAPLDNVLKLWQGLGYYSRARNMHEAAKFIVDNLEGEFPKSYRDLLKLKGVGDYTAAAVSSICFKEAVPVVDGNVFRVLSRLFLMGEPIDRASSRKHFKEVAFEIMDKKLPDLFNQAIMELGAIQCVPVNPNCGACPLKESCLAFEEDKVSSYPKKEKGMKTKNRYLYYLVMQENNSLFINKRTGNDIWKGLYEFPLIEKAEELPVEKLEMDSDFKGQMGETPFTIKNVSSVYIHVLSHQKLYARFIHLEVTLGYNQCFETFKTIDLKKLNNYAISRLIERYVESEYFQNKINNN